MRALVDGPIPVLMLFETITMTPPRLSGVSLATWSTPDPDEDEPTRVCQDCSHPTESPRSQIPPCPSSSTATISGVVPSPGVSCIIFRTVYAVVAGGKEQST